MGEIEARPNPLLAISRRKSSFTLSKENSHDYIPKMLIKHKRDAMRARFIIRIETKNILLDHFSRKKRSSIAF
jgi:hypothetical protein